MTLKSFLHYVELRTKVASILPFAAGTLYAAWRFERTDPLNLLLMLASLLCIDMATTASNHYTDFLKAVHKQGYNYEQHNTLARDGLDVKAAFRTIVLLVGLGAVFGLLLAFRTGWVVLAVGMLSFCIGLLYSWGPVPISRTPLAEAVSGFFMGFVIVFLSVYIHVADMGWIGVSLSGTEIILRAELYEIIRLFVMSMPLISGISNIMLSNNLCDLEEDRINGRHTLPVVIGQAWALRLSRLLFGALFLSAVPGLLLGWVPRSCAVIFLGIPFVYKASAAFYARQTKKETFVLSVKSFLLVGALYCVGIGLGLV